MDISDSEEGSMLCDHFFFTLNFFFICLLLKNRYIKVMLMILETLIMHGWRQKLWITMMKQVILLMFIKLTELVDQFVKQPTRTQLNLDYFSILSQSSSDYRSIFEIRLLILK